MFSQACVILSSMHRMHPPPMHFPMMHPHPGCTPSSGCDLPPPPPPQVDAPSPVDALPPPSSRHKTDGQ